MTRRHDVTSGHPAFGADPAIRWAPRRKRRPLRRLAWLLVMVAIAWFAMGRPTSASDIPTSLTDVIDAQETPALTDTAMPASPVADLTTPPPDAEGPFAVVRVVDGDTLIVARPEGETRVRVIGIDTPESVAPDQPVECFGPEAAQRAEQLLAGTSVMLRGDPTQDRTDKYGRELDYVWLPDGRLFNHVMLVEGYALEYTFAAPYAYQSEFRAAEGQAAQGEAGLWSPATCAGDIGA
ncbi:thermonuclease family protein [Cellulomonas wangsupingiae]|uniref:thermonuclease family protein n=1 Tax=Cellulomonas wangsupingiae TaxID=2968085 RepID=UPI001D0E1FB6|nr:thermonuclease family protein [Cellulomonas wangsupingiae]MCM0639517.1 thermonuclease family protein [Cellulomonas wangsupingiae]